LAIKPRLDIAYLPGMGFGSTKQALNSGRDGDAGCGR
jgi:hypothetical protein